ncbi:hypothetical protein NX059_010764 [Plenodomus lindquistii]|nr:hypothetical protein NX059_010764 [Plenodomus lindquistii]
MANSLLQEDIARFNALKRLETHLAAYRSIPSMNLQMNSFAAPTTRGLAALRHWFRGGPREQIRAHNLPLQDVAIGTYSLRNHVGDFVAVGPPSRRDYLSRLVTTVCDKVFKIRGEGPMQDLNGAYFYSESRIANMVSLVGALLGVGLLVGAIIGLDQLETKASRLGLICALTTAFAGVLLFTTTTTRGEVFGATAAYAAVLVVYVGGALGDSPAGA